MTITKTILAVAAVPTTKPKAPESPMHRMMVNKFGAKHLSTDYNRVGNLEHNYHTNRPLAHVTGEFGRMAGFSHSVNRGTHTYTNNRTGHTINAYESKHGGVVIEHHIHHDSKDFVKPPKDAGKKKGGVLDKIRHGLGISGGQDGVWVPGR